MLVQVNINISLIAVAVIIDQAVHHKVGHQQVQDLTATHDLQTIVVVDDKK